MLVRDGGSATGGRIGVGGLGGLRRALASVIILRFPVLDDAFGVPFVLRTATHHDHHHGADQQHGHGADHDDDADRGRGR